MQRPPRYLDLEMRQYWAPSHRGDLVSSLFNGANRKRQISVQIVAA